MIAFSITAFAKNTGVSFTLTNAQEFKPTNGKFYLPSYSDETNITLNFSSSFATIKLNGTEGEIVNDGSVIDLSQYKTTDEFGNECYKVSFYVGLSPDDYTVYKANSLPAISIQTSIGKESLLGSMITDDFAKVYAIVNVSDLNRFNDGDVVDVAALIECGLVGKELDGLKILGNGELTKKVTVKAKIFSASAKEKIEAVGGKTEVV
jgi:hypothetical protein